YRNPNAARSTLELIITAVPFVALWLVTWAAWEFGYGWLSLLLALPAAFFLVRLVMIPHDCGHGSFFRPRPAHHWGGRIIGVLTLTPYDSWKRSHAIHHGTSGNLDKRGIGDLETLTVDEYRARSAWGRIAYRLYRNPLVLFGVGPVYLFGLRHRFPLGAPTRNWRAWISPMATNLSIAAVVALMMYLVGVKPSVRTQVPIPLTGGWSGGGLFFTQHQLEDTMWASGGDGNVHAAALRGTSYYVLPAVLRWFTANIGIHH